MLSLKDITIKINKVALIFCLFIFNFCNTERYFQRLGQFPKISNQEENSENFLNDKTLSEFTTCHDLGKISFDENFMNANLMEMANGDKSILGFRDLKIEYKEYALYGVLGPAGIICVNYSGYAIRKKEQ